MDALDLLSGDEDDGDDAPEVTEPESKRQKTTELDFQALQRAGYTSLQDEDESSAAASLEKTFASLQEAAKSTEAPDLGTEIPGCATTYWILKEGDPVRTISKGCKVIVHATGVVKKTGKTFWSTRDDPRGPHMFLAGAGKKVVGWEEGCLGMKIGETRKLLVPSKEGYGAHGLPEWGISPHTDLEFTIECLDIALAD
eukprot:TRINITY_DN47769_c0_g1_i1.p1 TRINITY_DN47769_c0_g1~~TRINITY_DN47769_c0_g1_i1.p1  ORF type:complete len:198 (-),score=47.01 TRINITY_DN47769_c0_g1_i1:31-624(-)